MKRRKTEVICVYCNKSYLKANSEIKRNLALNRLSFCSKKCCSSYKSLDKNYHLYRHCGVNSNFDISKFSSNRKNQYSPFREFLRRINRRSKEVNIDLEYLKCVWDEQNGICPYTNVKLSLDLKSKSSMFNKASIDRIDSSKGYIKNNIQFVCMPINYMKHTMTHDQTLEFIGIILSNR